MENKRPNNIEWNMQHYESGGEETKRAREASEEAGIQGVTGEGHGQFRGQKEEETREGWPKRKKEETEH